MTENSSDFRGMEFTLPSQAQWWFSSGEIELEIAYVVIAWWQNKRNSLKQHLKFSQVYKHYIFLTCGQPGVAYRT